MLLKIFLVFCLYLISYDVLQAQRSKDEMLLSGDEELISYGMDTTYHWWALTSPYTDQYRLYIDGIPSNVYSNISGLKFSPDANKWAYFATDNVRLYLVTQDSIIHLKGDRPGTILYSPNSESMTYSYYWNNEEYIHHNNKIYKTYNRTGSFYINYSGQSIAFLGERVNSYVVNVNGVESQPFENIKVIGFWWDGELIYAAGSNSYCQIYKGKKEISEAYTNIRDTKININGDAAAFVATTLSGESVAVLISDEYYEPVVSKKYGSIGTLTLHPYLPLYAFSAVDGPRNLIVYSTSEYSTGRSIANPFFSIDGSELYYIYCDLSCYFAINGRNYKLDYDIGSVNSLAVKPGSLSYAYTNNTSLLMRSLDSKEIVGGMMVDETSLPRYNRFTGRYEALGRINNRLYLLTIRA